MARRSKAVDALGEVALFSACSPRELQRIARVGERRTIEAGTEIIHQGDLAHECYVIIDGDAVVRRNGRRVTTVGPGSAVGELSLFDAGPRTATVTAETDMDLLAIGSREFWALLEDVPALARKLLRRVAEMLRITDKRMFG